MEGRAERGRGDMVVPVDDSAMAGANSDTVVAYIDIDATDNPTTAAATLHFLGVKMEYSVTSLSD